MQGIELKEFQVNCVNDLLNATTIGDKKEVLVQAPTGSGKTIILLEYIKEYIEENDKTIFVWLTPGKGDLEEQRTQFAQYKEVEEKKLEHESKTLSQSCARFKELVAQFNSGFKKLPDEK